MSASKQQKQLNIRSDEAFELARELSKKLNRTTGAVVLDALRAYGTKQAGKAGELPEAMVAANRKRLKGTLKKLWGPAGPPRGMSSNHDGLYDENGLPK